MRYVRDRTGRFHLRPFYDQHELDSECERILHEFMLPMYGGIHFPIPTDCLTKLIERDADDLDLYADLSGHGSDVQGITEFLPGKKPQVQIAQDLSTDAARANRLRTTLTHEYGHVRFHDCLWQLEDANLDLFHSRSEGIHVCKRETILQAGVVDWLEWQAGYVSGALLMPVGSLRNVVQAFLGRQKGHGQVEVMSHLGQDLIELVSLKFQVSQEAAQVRLLKLSYLVVAAPAEPLLM